jgi:hypothetical protein
MCFTIAREAISDVLPHHDGETLIQKDKKHCKFDDYLTCIVDECRKKGQLDATQWLIELIIRSNMFRAPLCPSSGTPATFLNPDA